MRASSADITWCVGGSKKYFYVRMEFLSERSFCEHNTMHSAPGRYTAYLQSLALDSWAYKSTIVSTVVPGRTRDEKREMAKWVAAYHRK